MWLFDAVGRRSWFVVNIVLELGPLPIFVVVLTYMIPSGNDDVELPAVFSDLCHTCAFAVSMLAVRYVKSDNMFRNKHNQDIQTSEEILVKSNLKYIPESDCKFSSWMTQPEIECRGKVRGCDALQKEYQKDFSLETEQKDTFCVPGNIPYLYSLIN